MWILGVELQHRVKIGRGLRLWHGQSLVVHKSTQIGANCTIRHSTTIGAKKDAQGIKMVGAIIGNNVDIGAHTCIIGNVSIGNDTIIGAGSIVTRSLPPNVIAAGNPARIIKTIS